MPPLGDGKLLRMGDKQVLQKHKEGTEQRQEKCFHLDPHRAPSGWEQLLCCRQTAVELAISNLIVSGALIPNADKFGCEVSGRE